MPTDDDKASAWIRFDGEAKRLRIRRPRPDRDGLQLFSRRRAAQSVTLSPAELAALFEGRTLACDVQGEYVLYLRIETGALDAIGLIGSLNGSKARRGNGPERGACPIPQREDPGALPTYAERVLAARIRVKIDRQQRRPRVKTPEWIVRLADGDIGR